MKENLKMINQKIPVLFVFVLFMTVSLSSCIKQSVSTEKTTQNPKTFVFDRKPKTPIVFLSTQLNPVEEAAKMRNDILKDFPGQVEFRPNDSNYVFDQITALQKKDPGKTILIGALHGDLEKLQEQKSLMPVDAIYAALTDRKINQNLISLSKLDGKSAYYIPWMQASFLMVANKKALKYLPKGASLQSLTYDQLAEWAKNIQAGTKKPGLGFPAGEKGLMHRFLQGYLYPSYTRSTLLKYRSDDAKTMWIYFRDLWKYVHPGSLTYSSMDEPLLMDDVLIAWDHTARLIKVFEKRPEDFVAFPAPIGPKGRGFMTVVSGLAIPNKTSDTESLEILIDYLTQPAVQIRTLLATGFFPVLEVSEGDSLSGNMKELYNAVSNQTNSTDSIPTLLPIGLGESGAAYNSIFMLTFSEIVLGGKDINSVLDESAKELQSILDKQNLKCWLPDISDERPCKIE